MRNRFLSFKVMGEIFGKSYKILEKIENAKPTLLGSLCQDLPFLQSMSIVLMSSF
jgi:hypothetical protein